MNKAYHFFSRILQKLRIIHYRLISDSNHSSCFKKAIVVQPVLFKGKGKIILNGNIVFGVNPSPFLYSGYHHIEARNEGSEIIIGANVAINNNATIIADRAKISIGNNTIIGTNLTIFDSDFHNMDPHNRLSENYSTSEVHIGKNVFIGANVTILKGVKIGDNSVIGSGSIVVKTIAPNVIAAGNPCKEIKSL